MVFENIKKACELAENPGNCYYRNFNGEPLCVVAHFFNLEDPGSHLNLMEGRRIFDIYKYSVRFDSKYGEDFWDKLSKLQDFWDNSEDRTNEQLLEYAEVLFLE